MPSYTPDIMQVNCATGVYAYVHVHVYLCVHACVYVCVTDLLKIFCIISHVHDF